MKKILIILAGVLLVYGEPVIAKNELTGITIAKKISKAKKVSKKKKTVQKKKKVLSKSKKKVVTKKKIQKKRKKVVRTRVRYNVGEIQSYAHSLVLSYGWSENDWNAFVQIINHESGWRVTAENPKSHAYGLCQSLPGKKMASAGSDWRNNYKTQLKWCMSYIKGRYGSPTSAWAFWQKHHWY